MEVVQSFLIICISPFLSLRQYHNVVFIFTCQGTADGKLPAKSGTVHYFSQFLLTFLKCALFLHKLNLKTRCLDNNHLTNNEPKAIERSIQFLYIIIERTGE